MTYIIGETATYEEKTRDLCEAILEDPKLKAAFADIESFLSNDVAKEAFSSMQQKGEELQAKQQTGIELTAGEVEEFNKLREGVESNKEASAFLAAQEEMHKVQTSVNTWIGMTMELGRVPTEADFKESGESCGTG
ncbi:MAG: YlbF family regulator [Verrucomicrobiales bacterium]